MIRGRGPQKAPEVFICKLAIDRGRKSNCNVPNWSLESSGNCRHSHVLSKNTSRNHIRLRAFVSSHTPVSPRQLAIEASGSVRKLRRTRNSRRSQFRLPDQVPAGSLPPGGRREGEGGGTCLL